MHEFTQNSDRSSLEVVAALAIFSKDPFMRLKRKNLGPTNDLNKGIRERAMAKDTKVGEGEEDTLCTLARKGKIRLLLERGSKLRQALHLPLIGQRYTSQDVINFSFFYSFWYLLNMRAKTCLVLIL